MTDSKRLLLIAAAVAVAAFIFQMGLQNAMRVYAPQGLYFQGWSSESITQTVPIQDLRDAPLQTLLNIHIEPPAFDSIRAIFVTFSPSKDIHAALVDVDYHIEILWAILYSLAAAVIFLWTAQMARIWIGLVTAAVFVLHPGSIFYTTLLDPTILTTFLIVCMYYLLWLIKRGSVRAVPAFAGVTLALFFTKSIFQLPVILLLGLCLFLLKVPRRPLLMFFLVSGGVALLYTAKQYYLFHVFSTSSFAGYNLCKSVGIDNHYVVHFDFNRRDESGLADVLTRENKLTGGLNYNNINYLDFSNYLNHKYVKYMLTFPFADLASNYLQNLQLYWQPSSRYAREVNAIVERLPYRAPFDAVFSYPVFPALLLAAGILALGRTLQQKSYAACAAMLLPALVIFVISVIGDKGENMRYKYFLEPVFIVFIVSEFHNALSRPNPYERTA